jgi:hypothetical protein
MRSGASLEFIVDGRTVFWSAGRWLHPLFQLERYLSEHGIDGSAGEVHDKIVGRGSAFLIARLGIRRAHAGLLSRPGKDVFDRSGIACSWDDFVDEIECRTEGILRSVTDAEEAYRLLLERAQIAPRDGGQH